MDNHISFFIELIHGIISPNQKQLRSSIIIDDSKVSYDYSKIKKKVRKTYSTIRRALVQVSDTEKYVLEKLADCMTKIMKGK